MDNNQSEIERLVSIEVKKQMEPTTKALENIAKQNAEQTKLLNEHIAVVSEFDHWRKALWGNGTGPKGFLELAREEDRLHQIQSRRDVQVRYDEILKEVSTLKAESYRKEGEATYKKEMLIEKNFNDERLDK